MRKLIIRSITFMFVASNAGIWGIERADRLAGLAAISEGNQWIMVTSLTTSGLLKERRTLGLVNQYWYWGGMNWERRLIIPEISDSRCTREIVSQYQTVSICWWTSFGGCRSTYRSVQSVVMMNCQTKYLMYSCIRLRIRI